MKLSSLFATWALAVAASVWAQQPDVAGIINGSVRASVQDTLKNTSTKPKDTQNIKVKAFVDQAIQDILWANARRDGWTVVIDVETNGGKNGWQLYAGKSSTPNIDYIPSSKNSAWVRYRLDF